MTACTHLDTIEVVELPDDAASLSFGLTCELKLGTQASRLLLSKTAGRMPAYPALMFPGHSLNCFRCCNRSRQDAGRFCTASA